MAAPGPGTRGPVDAEPYITLMRQIRSHGPVAPDEGIYIAPISQPCAGIHGPVAFMENPASPSAVLPHALHPYLPSQAPARHEYRSPRYPSILDSATDKSGINGLCRKRRFRGQFRNSRVLSSVELIETNGSEGHVIFFIGGTRPGTGAVS